MVALFVPQEGYGPFGPGLDLLRGRLLSFSFVRHALEPVPRVIPCGMLRQRAARLI